jgi:demethylmenaquinone methyltransferase/2-methoxy-6-polyprenyl-1,4-benzoquinol methylase
VAHKQEQIVDMFNEISKTYDLLNRLLSFGIDKRWRKIACKKAYDFYGIKPQRIVDVACGTGDVLLFWQKEAQKRGFQDIEYFGVDPSIGMLEVAKQKVSFAKFFEAKATQIPLEEKSADFISIAYGIRNVVQRQKAWEEFYRVLKPGGLLVVLEFTKDKDFNLFAEITKWYMKKAIPFIGKIISKHSEAYDYLPSSIDAFTTTKEIEEEMKKVGFVTEFIQGYTFNISTLFIMRK